MPISPDPKSTDQPTLTLERRGDGVLAVRLAGAWRLADNPRGIDEIGARLDADPTLRAIVVDASEVSAWDTALAVFLRRLASIAENRRLTLTSQGLPRGAERLLALALAVPPAATRDAAAAPNPIARLGISATAAGAKLLRAIGFVGEVILALIALLRGRARFRPAELATSIQQAGPDALPIISLISFLVGLILAFVGAVQLSRFGAQVYIADLVGLAMAREMGALMVAIMMAGRTGAAFAAHIGTMRVNQEIDALETLGISPVEFLVLPRVLALVLMMPLLTIYAILVGVAGGLAVSVGLFEITLALYWEETLAAVSLTQLIIGLTKSLVFAVLVAIAGCRAGMQAGGSAASVGEAATTAVVTSIVAIVVADGLFAVVLNALNL